ncbi:MAG: hypothetical protein IT355_16620 [Gemmatimonadaceae bacterium]|nr:hypothetical protein [Gemmatimonadaceae bacterium]
MRRTGLFWGMLVTGMAGGAAALPAQSPSQPDVPPAYAPPAGMCRVWLRDVPPVQQPAPTDCRSALRAKPVGATVIYGPEVRRSGLPANDWSRPLVRPARDEERARAGLRGMREPCTDVNRDGACAVTGDGCIDARDARCDDTTALPGMRSAMQWIEGQRPAELQRWFGGLNVAARFPMPPRGGLPDRVQWFDSDGRLVQIWTDRNGDGRADRVEMFSRDGARTRVVGQP